MHVDGEALTAPRIFLNVGGRASVPDMPGVDDVPYLDNTTMVRWTRCREHLVVVGGSYVGLEFAQMYRRFGAEVTVVERADAADRARGPGCFGGDPRDPRGGRHRGAHRRRLHRLRPRSDGVAVSVDCTDGAPK